MLRSVIILTVLAVFPFATIQSQNQRINTDAIDAFFKTTYDSLAIVPGFAVGIVQDGEVVYEKTYGWADIKSNYWFTEHTQFYIASTTKSFTALSAVILEEKGLLDLDKSLVDYFPKVNFPDSIQPSKITLKLLLSHTSGIDNSTISFPKAQSGTYTNKQLYDLMNKTFGRKELGEYRYSNLGYNIMNLIFMKELGKTWGEVVQEQILDPLDMSHTYSSYVELLENKEDLATNYHSLGYGLEGKLEHLRKKRSDKTLHAAGGLFSSLHDVVKWLQLQTDIENAEKRYGISKEALLKTREEIATVQPKGFSFLKQQYSYGLGWNLATFGDNTLFFHGGAYAGHRTMISFIPDIGTGVVIMVNDAFMGNGVAINGTAFIYDSIIKSKEESDWDKKHYDWIDQVKEEIDMFGKRIAKDVENRASRTFNFTVDVQKLVGIYFNEDGEEIRIFLKDDKLNIVQGDLVGGVEPYVEPNTIRLDLATVRVLEFDIEGDKVKGFNYVGGYFEKY